MRLGCSMTRKRSSFSHFFMVIFTALVQKRSDFISVLKWLDALIVSRQTGRRKEKTLDTLLPVIFLTFRTHVHQQTRRRTQEKKSKRNVINSFLILTNSYIPDWNSSSLLFSFVETEMHLSWRPLTVRYFICMHESIRQAFALICSRFRMKILSVLRHGCIL